MKKIPTLFERDWNGDRSRVVDQVHAGCEWVLAGEGWGTRKLDGTCCMVRSGRPYKRRELRAKDKEPTGFETVDVDAETRKTVGWVPVGDGPEDRWHRDAFSRAGGDLPDGTYELVGPKVQGNPEGEAEHKLIAHDSATLRYGADQEPPRTFGGLSAWLDGADIEGIVWHHPDGRMAKIKKRDFGLKR